MKRLVFMEYSTAVRRELIGLNFRLSRHFINCNQ